MCGIAGIIGRSSCVETETVLRAMRDAQWHRGPDDSGLNFIRIGENVLGLAHTRLAVLDLSAAGHQPMEDLTTGNWITYNGEIFNYWQLREELEDRQEIGWKSRSDTEVILRAYAKWGTGCLQHFRGMYAFALWDKQAQRLFLARDPFGIKPLYYYQKDDCFLFASEIRALLASGLVARKLSPDGLASYLQFGSVQDPLTIIDGVQALLPGHGLIVESKNDRLQIECRNYSNDRFTATASADLTRGQAVENVRVTLEESVRRHLVSDVPVGVFLSGGIDSSAIVALMSRVVHERPKTFSVVFTESEFSEAEHARLVAKRFGTEHREILLSEESLLDLLLSALEAMDQPTMDGINTFVISKAVKEAGVTVALSGLGGDELFAGYPSFRRAVQLQKIGPMPQGLRRSASTLGRALLNGTVRRTKFWDLVESDCSPHAAYAISRRLFSPSEIEVLITGGASSKGLGVMGLLDGQNRPQYSFDQKRLDLTPYASRFTPDDVVNTMSWLELTGYMSNTLLRDTDQMSMANGLEARVPFVDPEVVRLVLGLPGSWKMNGQRPKALLLDALPDMLPEEVWNRPKMGFTLPFERWLQSTLQSELNAILSNEGQLKQSGLNTRYASTLWQSFKEDPSHQSWSRPWALYVLENWCRLNNVSQE